MYSECGLKNEVRDTSGLQLKIQVDNVPFSYLPF